MNSYRHGIEQSDELFNDETLVQLAKDGGHAAYAELSKRHSAKIFRVLVRITKNSEDAEDALQETLMKAFVHLKTFDGRSTYSTWLTRIAINSAFTVLRKRRTQCEVSLDAALDDEGSSYMQVADPSTSPESLYFQCERELRLRQAIRKLPPGLRECIEIQHTRDATVQEVAEMMGLSITATKSRMLKARKIVVASVGAKFQRSIVRS
jgi:RNA polymerase sigma factor (sigma-70 family)